ncbi:MAG: hypothetical protein ACKOA8_17080 [Deltaproteobacteria bacterium]
MKTLTQITFGILVAILLVSCGKENGSSSRSGVMKHTLVIKRASSIQRSCPLRFAQSGLCGGIQWISGPSADKESSFYVTFWDEKTGSEQGPWVEPAGQVGSFIRMTCCGSVFFPTVSKAETGKYLVSKVKFTPGKWELYVQLKKGNDVEKQFVSVNLDD